KWDINNGGSGYIWRYITNNDNNNNANHARIWQLNAGSSYTLRVFGREKNTYMDQIRIRQDPAVPSSTPTPMPPTPTYTSSPTPVPGAQGLCMTVYTGGTSLSGAS